ncbi:MAG TPA: hypothetical protein VIF15_16870 [Polyangiaceae bacterium]
MSPPVRAVHAAHPSPSAIPSVRGTLVAGVVGAVGELWGDAGLRQVSDQLGPEARHALCEQIVVPVAWYPEEIMASWCHAVWLGLAREDEKRFDTFVRAGVEHGWSWVHRALLRLATPRLLARRAPAIWRHDHTHGELGVELGDRRAILRVTDYPHARSAVMRRGQTESLRHILTLARFRDVRASHVVDAAGSFVATLHWT